MNKMNRENEENHKKLDFTLIQWFCLSHENMFCMVFCMMFCMKIERETDFIMQNLKKNEAR